MGMFQTLRYLFLSAACGLVLNALSISIFRVQDDHFEPRAPMAVRRHGKEGSDPLSFPQNASRSERFPSAAARVKIYMSDWYVPPCENNTAGFVQYFSDVKQDVVHVRNEWRKGVGVPRNAALESLFVGSRREFEHCAMPRRMPVYCGDVVNRLIPAMERIGWTDESSIPLLFHFGDRRQSRNLAYVNFPHIKKYRSAYNRQDLQKISDAECHREPRPIRNGELEAIIWKLNVERHYGALKEIPGKDIPWERKQNKAVFRGRLSAPNVHYPGELARCMACPRCRLVYRSSTMQLIDAKLSADEIDTINGVKFHGRHLGIKELLEYKAIIMVEGLDVATGLKWALFSKSVVMMVPPTRTSWAMEERLEPWVHYIPLSEDISDVEDKMKWINSHDEQARKIANRATLWIEDLMYHPDAEKDNLIIEEEILRRYQKHFRQGNAEDFVA